MSFWKKLFGGKQSEAPPAKPESTSVTSTQKTEPPKVKAESIVGSKYPSVKIGTQVWMTENLNVYKFRNGDLILEVTSIMEWEKEGDDKKPAWCYYDNDPANGNIYGKLYNWYAVIDPRGLGPEGWHVPSDKEWRVLTEYLGGSDLAGGKMKSTGTQYWESPNKGATNSSGFSGLPGGGRSLSRDFFGVGGFGDWWGSSEGSANDAWNRGLHYYGGNVLTGNRNKFNGLSVRCLRD